MRCRHYIIAMLDLYVTVSNGSTSTDRYILPISRRTEYTAHSQKAQQGFPTTLLVRPAVAQHHLLAGPGRFRGVVQLLRLHPNSGHGVANGQTAAMNSYALPAFAAGLAAKLAVAWAPEKVVMLKAEAMESYAIFSSQNVETENVYITPSLNSYWRT